MTLKEIKNKNGEAALWGKTIYIIVQTRKQSSNLYFAVVETHITCSKRWIFVMKLILKIKPQSEKVDGFPLSHSPNPLKSEEAFSFP